MIELAPYSPFYEAATLRRIDAFWGFHSGLVGREAEDSPAAEDLRRWTDDGHTLLVILEDGADVGFVHLQRSGPIVMELADIFVDEARRGCGIASAAELITRWMQPQGYALLRTLSATSVVQEKIPLAPVVRLFETEGKRLLVAVNPTRSPISVTAEFAVPQKIQAEDSDEHTLRLLLKAESGTIFTWEK